MSPISDALQFCNRQWKATTTSVQMGHQEVQASLSGYILEFKILSIFWLLVQAVRHSGRRVGLFGWTRLPGSILAGETFFALFCLSLWLRPALDPRHVTVCPLPLYSYINILLYNVQLRMWNICAVLFQVVQARKSQRCWFYKFRYSNTTSQVASVQAVWSFFIASVTPVSWQPWYFHSRILFNFR